MLCISFQIFSLISFMSGLFSGVVRHEPVLGAGALIASGLFAIAAAHADRK